MRVSARRLPPQNPRATEKRLAHHPPRKDALTVEAVKGTLYGEAIFYLLSGYLLQCAGLGRRVITEDETLRFRVVAAKIE